MQKLVFALFFWAQPVQASLQEQQSTQLAERHNKTGTAVKALASVLHARDAAAGYSHVGPRAGSSTSASRPVRSNPDGPTMLAPFPPWEEEPEPWIPSWLSEEEIAEERVEAAEKWKPPPPPEEPWLSPLMSDEEQEQELEEYRKRLEELGPAPTPQWVTDWIERGGMDPPTPPPWKPTWMRIEGDYEHPPVPRRPGKKPYKGSPYPPWELQPEPWIPSWLDEEEQEEERYEEALKYRPPEPPEEPWLSPLDDDEERQRVIDDHRLKVEEMGPPPVPKWVTDWLAQGGEATPAPPPWKPSWQREAEEAPATPGVPAPAPAGAAEDPVTSKWPMAESAAAPGPAVLFRTAQNMGTLFKEGDVLNFKVSDMSKEGTKLRIKFKGPFDFTAESEIAPK